MFYLVFGGGKISKGSLFSIKEVRERFCEGMRRRERVCEGEENGGKEMAAGCFPGRLQSGKEGKNFGVGK